MLYHGANLNLARESEAHDLFAEIDFRLGRAYEKSEQPSKAVEHLERFLDHVTDAESRGRACLSLASCHQQLGKAMMMIAFQRLFLTIFER